MNREDRIQRSREDLQFFIDYYFSDRSPVEPAVMWSMQVDDIVSFLDDVDPARACFFKVIWDALFSDSYQVIFLRDSEVAAKAQAKMAYEFSHNTRLAQDFGDENGNISIDVKDTEIIVLGKSRIDFREFRSKVKGLKYKELRPGLYICDDREAPCRDNVAKEELLYWVLKNLVNEIAPVYVVGDRNDSNSLIAMFSEHTK